jgi:3-dehydroquinate synthase II
VLVGSSAKALCLVHGETLATPFVPARPFRVNAGPVHSYVSHLIVSRPT